MVDGAGTRAVREDHEPPSPHDSPAVPPLLSVAIITTIGLVMVFAVPIPSGVTPQGWRMLAIFVCTVLALMLRPIPGGAAVVFGVLITMLSGVLTPAQALAGYGNPTVWLVVSAFLFSRAVINCGLARRLALFFIRTVGHTSLGLGYSLVGCDVVMASVIPGNSARIGGILMPIARSLSGIYESRPGPTADRLGRYLMLTLYQGDMVACAMYLTGQVGNPIAAALALQNFGVSMTWARWLTVSILPALVSFAVVPWFIYRISPPAIRHTPEAADMARRELSALGPLSASEMKVIAVFVLVCGLWAASALHTIPTVTVALLGVVVLLATNALAWNDVIREHRAWDVFLWFGGIIRMGEAINEFGVTTAFANSASGAFAGWTWPALMVVIVVVFFYVHYFFASVTTHVVSMFVPFATLLVAAGAPVQLVIFSLAFYANLSACLTHFGTVPGPILFSAGFVSIGTWWRAGLLVSFVHLAIWSTVGLVWWRILGLW